MASLLIGWSRENRNHLSGSLDAGVAWWVSLWEQRLAVCDRSRNSCLWIFWAFVLKFKRLDGVQNALEAIASAFLDGDRQRIILATQLAKLGKPIRTIWGANDRIIPASHSNVFGEAAKVYVFPKRGPHGADGSC